MDLLNLHPNELVIALLLVVGIALLTWAVRARRRAETGTGSVSTPGRVCLVLLRMAIGWHFLVEGIEKVETPSWSSEGYLREASGPLGAHFREVAGDSVIAQLSPGDDPNALPPALDAEWQRYFDAFASHYNLDETQRRVAQVRFEKARTATLLWLNAPHSVKLASAIPPEIPKDMTVAERLTVYEKKQKKLAEIETEMPRRGRAAWKDWKEAKADLAKWRGDLKKDLDGQTAAFKKALDETLSAEQKMSPVPETSRPINWRRQLDVADAVVKWGLVLVGIGLIAGCFTRLAAVFGAVLLLMFFLAMPPLPYLPESPKAEGHYLYINKNIIEMLALLSLACLPTGRWAGVDGLLQFVNPFNWEWKKKKVVAVEEKKKVAEAVTGGRGE